MNRTILSLTLLALAAASQASLLTFTASMDGAQDNVATNGIGDGFLQINDADLSFSGYIRWKDLTGVASNSHIHVGAPGVAGNVIIPIGNEAGSFLDGAYHRRNFSGTLTTMGGAAGFNHGGAGTSGDVIPADQITKWFLAGNTYFNVHTARFPGGEIRGQLQAVPEPGTWAAFGLGGLALMRRRARRR